MGNRSHIEWTDATWNPVTGCTKVSQGCKHCYAERMAHRLQAMGSPRYRNGFQVTLHADVLNQPLHWIKPRRIFVNSMSDVFHPDVPDTFIADIFAVMAQTPRHTYQILTKHPERLARMAGRLPFPPHVWIGTSVESQEVGAGFGGSVKFRPPFGFSRVSRCWGRCRTCRWREFIGHCGRRVGTPCPAYAPRVGVGYPGPMCSA